MMSVRQKGFYCLWGRDGRLCVGDATQKEDEQEDAFHVIGFESPIENKCSDYISASQLIHISFASLQNIPLRSTGSFIWAKGLFLMTPCLWEAFFASGPFDFMLSEGILIDSG
jgi:hypothetical protein